VYIKEAFVSKSRNWLTAAGLVYVLVWIIGLLIDPHAPDLNQPSVTLAAFYQAHWLIHLVQVTLIHGVAALALIAFAAALGDALREGTDSTVLTTLSINSAVAAASLSLIQAALGAALVSPTVLVGDASAIPVIRTLINTGDTFKLLALALFVGSTIPPALARRVLPRWLAWVGSFLMLSLIVGGLSFIVGNSALSLVLYLALPLLLLWVGAVSVILLRRARIPEQRMISRSSLAR
jgi:hypothetical protein